MADKKMESVDEYIRKFEGEVQKRLTEVRSIVKEEAGNAKEVMSWGMPTYKLNGNLIHFAGHKNHIGIYPGAEGIIAFEEEFKKRGYKYSKGAVQLPLKEELPEELLRSIVKHRIKAVQQ